MSAPTFSRSTTAAPLDFVGRLHAYLPEPVPSRAEALEGLDLTGWLRDVVAADGQGFAVLAGGGTTFIMVYAEGVPIAASLSRNGADVYGGEAIQALVERGPMNVFALTYMCVTPVALALSSLFGSAGPRLRLEADPRALAACLAAAKGERAAGALVVDAGEDAWSILLLADGSVVAGYGSDDRTLKSGVDDATVLLHRDDLWVSRLRPHVSDLRVMLDRRGTDTSSAPIDETLLDIEAALIGELARLEHLLTRASQSDERLSLVVSAFASVLAELDTLPLSPNASPTPASSIRDFAVDGLIARFEQRVEGYVAWLAQSDEAAARFLSDAAGELTQQARALLHVRIRG